MFSLKFVENGRVRKDVLFCRTKQAGLEAAAVRDALHVRQLLVLKTDENKTKENTAATTFA